MREKTPKRKPKRPDMSLDEYKRYLHGAVDAFAEHWAENAKRKPGDWPLQMKDSALESAAAQWSDQFRAWMGWDD